MPQELYQWDHEHVWHPFCPMEAYRAESPPIIVAAEGCELIDLEGNRYLDGVSSLWCNVHGHRVPEIDAAIRAQLDRVAHTTLLGLGNEPSIRLARRLVEIAPPGLTKVFYSDSGATAVEIALKMAYQYYLQRGSRPEHRDLFLAFGDAYHGDTLGAAAVGGIPAFHERFEPILMDVVRVPAPRIHAVPDGLSPADIAKQCIAAFDRAIEQYVNRLAAVVIEPLIQAAAGMVVHPPGFLAHVRRRTAEMDVLLIADEVATGFGRTGNLFACEEEQVAPDFLCLAKGLTGGYLPLAATLTSDAVFAAFLGPADAGRTFFHGHTYTGNPLGSAAALASLDLLFERDLVARTRRLAGVVAERLAPLADSPHVGSIRQKGLMVGIELLRDRATRTPYPRSERRGHQVTLAARRRGAILRPLGDIVVLMPPLAIAESDLDRLLSITLAALTEVTGF